MNNEKYGSYGSMLEEFDGTWINSVDRRADIIQKGNRVKLKVEKKGKAFTVLGAKLIEVGTAPAQGTTGRKGDILQIRYSAALKNAVPAAGVILANGGFALGNAKAADKKTLILSLIDELTAKYFKETDELTAVTEAAEIDEDMGDAHLQGEMTIPADGGGNVTDPFEDDF